jgi:hypothetical protein
MPQGDYEGALKRALLIYRQNGWKSLMQGGVGIGMLMLWDWDKGRGLRCYYWDTLKKALLIN